MEPIKGYTRSGHAEAVGLYAYTCTNCGKRFESTTQHAYKIVSKNRTRMYCSYSCFRVDDKKEREAYKNATLGRWTSKADNGSEADRIQKKMDTCRKRIEAAQGKMDAPEWDMMTEKQKKRIQEQAAYWYARLMVLETELEEMKMLGL